MESIKHKVGETVGAGRWKHMGLALADVVLFAALLVFFLFLLSVPVMVLCPELGQAADNQALYPLMLNEALLLAATLLAACVVLRIRKLPWRSIGFSWQGWQRKLWSGALFVVCMYAAGFGLSWLLGTVEVEGFRFVPSYLLASLGFFLLVALTEEVMVRGFVLGRMLEGGVPRFVALFASSALFSLMHVFNPDFSLLPFLNIVLAGCFLGASCLYTRNLCFPIALHWFWNWVQGPVLGYRVSGNVFDGSSLLQLRLPEENLINGGAFGFEGSLLCSLLLVVGTLLIVRQGERHK